MTTKTETAKVPATHLRIHVHNLCLAEQRAGARKAPCSHQDPTSPYYLSPRELAL